MAPRTEPRLIVIGCGTAGIALAARLRFQLGYKNFIIYEREDAVGGTWHLNTYPGVGCDVDSHLYSFSFHHNPNWSRRFAEQPEILQYLNDTVDKFGIRPHVQLRTEVVSAKWDSETNLWEVRLREMDSGHEFVQEAEMFVSCVGTLSVPKDCNIPGHKSYNGAIFHSARWNHDFDITGKKIAVVENGCSVAQLMSKVSKKAGHVTQFQRSPQWINKPPNKEFSNFRKWCFRNIPLYGRYLRYSLWSATDRLHTLYMTGSSALDRARDEAQEAAEDYMRKTAPKEYHDVLIPKFPLGCKRRVFNPGYLESLHRPNVELTTEKIVEFTETGVRTTARDIDADAVILSTGSKVQEFLSPIKIDGRSGKTLNEHWKNNRGAQAYKATFDHGFPNFGIIFGPNAIPAHNSVIYSNETQAEYIIKTLIAPMLKGSFDVLDVKQAAETRDANEVQRNLKSMVWSSGCANWNLDETGRNTTNYHDPTWKFWWALYWPVWEDFNLYGGHGNLPMAPWTKAGVWVAAMPVAVAGLLKGYQFVSRNYLS